MNQIMGREEITDNGSALAVRLRLTHSLIEALYYRHRDRIVHPGEWDFH